MNKKGKGLWDSLKSWYLGEALVKKARLRILKSESEALHIKDWLRILQSEYEALHMKDGGTINDYGAKISRMMSKISSTVGATLEDKKY